MKGIPPVISMRTATAITGIPRATLKRLRDAGRIRTVVILGPDRGNAERFASPRCNRKLSTEDVLSLVINELYIGGDVTLINAVKRKLKVEAEKAIKHSFVHMGNETNDKDLERECLRSGFGDQSDYRRFADGKVPEWVKAKAAKSP